MSVINVKVGYMTFGVIFSSIEDFGWCDKALGAIHISTDQTIENQAATVIHELFHAIHYVWRLPDKMDEETAVDGLSVGWATVWKDNPELVEWLGEMLNDCD